MASPLDVTLLLFGAFSLIFIATSNIIREKLYLNEAIFAVVFGMIIGPYCLDLVNVELWGSQEIITTEFTRVVIAIQVMVTGAALPGRYIYDQFQALLVMLLPVMLSMWFVSGSLVYLMIPGLSYIESLMIASCFTPTDPVLSSSIVQGRYAEKYVRREIRDLIAAESGANDGLGYPFLFIAVYWMQMPVGEAFKTWFISIMLQEIAASIALGLLVGYLARILIKWCYERDMVELEALHVYPLMITFLLLGALACIKSDDLLACFMAGCTLSWDEWFKDIVLNIGVFAYIGVTMPFPTFAEISVWRLVVLAILVLLFRRVPIVLGVYKINPVINNWREAVFTGWFGPMGVGAIFYYATAAASITSSQPALAAVVYFIVLSSVIVHGLSIPVIVIIQYLCQQTTDSEKRNMQHSVTDANETTTAINMPPFDSRSHSRNNNGNNKSKTNSSSNNSSNTCVNKD
ncbi:Cation/H+ exchanger [Zychaea mexicana]|uniref:Cation/H+ exchanger n=1 Tax=Zychaea mexicana TaxID=64656 RepID=UPI0022FDECF5|nr:Cation/H+ exchanger [Zychaea mexicana]KAI9484591.1 Cation/H+ exchanger [Zychaea mexicana]